MTSNTAGLQAIYYVPIKEIFIITCIAIFLGVMVRYLDYKFKYNDWQEKKYNKKEMLIACVLCWLNGVTFMFMIILFS